MLVADLREATRKVAEKFHPLINDAKLRELCQLLENFMAF